MQQATPSFIPSPSVSLVNGRPATTSLEVAKFFGKRHDVVLRDVRGVFDATPDNFRLHNFVESSYVNEQGKEQPMFILHRDGFMLLVMGYTGKQAIQIKIAYIEAFNAMEKALTEKTVLPLPEITIPPRSKLVSICPISGRPATTSLLVARLFGKQHDHVVLDTDSTLLQLPENSLQPNFVESTYEQKTSMGIKRARMFYLHRDAFSLVVMGYTGKKAMQVKVACIEAFNAIEKQLPEQTVQPQPAPLPVIPKKRQPGPIELEMNTLVAELELSHSKAYKELDSLVNRARNATSPIYKEVYKALGWHERCGVVMDGITDGLIHSSYESIRQLDKAFYSARLYIRQFRTLAHLLEK